MRQHYLPKELWKNYKGGEQVRQIVQMEPVNKSRVLSGTSSSRTRESSLQGHRPHFTTPPRAVEGALGPSLLGAIGCSLQLLYLRAVSRLQRALGRSQNT